MKLFKKCYQILCSNLSSRKNIRLKRKMGFNITLSDIENINFKVKKIITKRG